MAMNQLRVFDKETNSMMNFFAVKAGFCRLALALLLAAPLASPAAEPRTFATPEAAVDALVTALKANDEAALLAIFGDKHKNLIVTDDNAADAAQRAETAERIKTFSMLDERGPDKRVLLIGTQAWPVPIPLVRAAGVWHFATEEGVDELINRRIGANERNAISVLRTYVGAQSQYASRDRVGDGVRQYARKIRSTPGKQDGLYWPADEAKGEELSPVGPLLATESPTYMAARKEGDPYRGYRFRILTGQGKSAAGGAYSYVINGRMIAGYGMVAYPADYGDSGVMTFIVNHNGKIFEKDLGKNTAAAAKMTTFDPGPGWKEVAP
jgi:hypothetical protein